MQLHPPSPPESGELAEAMAQVARILEATDGLGNTLQAMVHLALGTIPGTDHAAVSLIRGSGIETVATTDGLPPRVDVAQYDTGQGPCVHAAREELVARLQDTAHNQRWPEFSRRAAGLGVGSMLSFQLTLDAESGDDQMGALNLYAALPDAFDEHSEQIGMVFAAHASVALAAAERERQLREALDARDLIGQAKGMIMSRFGLDADKAFGVLVRLSRDTNTKLRDVAAKIAGGELDPTESTAESA